LQGGEPRTLDDTAALMLGQAALISLHDWLSSPSRVRQFRGFSFFIFIITLLLSQQRTATFATLAGAGILLIFSPTRNRMMILALGGSAAIIATTLIFMGWVASGGDLDPYMPRAFSMLRSSDSTYGWRVQQWNEYLDAYWLAPAIDQLIGQPIGLLRATALNYGPFKLQFEPHSQYMTLLISAGFLGVLLFVAMLVLAELKGIILCSVSKIQSSYVPLAMAVLAMHAVSSYTYPIPGEAGLLFATAFQMIAFPSLRPRRSSAGITGTNWHPVAR
jgi:hypothetical protein